MLTQSVPSPTPPKTRSKGATLAELTDATAWQQHSTRAFLTGLRKKGLNLVRECRTNGDTCWRIEL